MDESIERMLGRCSTELDGVFSIDVSLWPEQKLRAM